jgi:hypothetical protein
VIEKQARCSRCGTLREDWDPALGGRYDAFMPVRTHCLPCEQLEWEYESMREEGGNHKGTTIVLERQQIGPARAIGGQAPVGRPIV